MASGGLAGLQTAIIVSALPLTIIVLVMCYGLVKVLNKDFKEQKQEQAVAQTKVKKIPSTSKSVG